VTKSKKKKHGHFFFQRQLTLLFSKSAFNRSKWQ